MRSLVIAIMAFMLALLLGLGSAWVMIAKGSPLTTGAVGVWRVWYKAGNPESDPYTKAYQARTGRLPITSTNALYYAAHTDASGDKLTSDCNYIVEGQPLNAIWWSVALYDQTGRLIPNKANRYSFNRADVARRADGTFQISIGSRARPGNWLPAGERGRLQLLLRIYGPRNFNDTVKGRLLENSLPTITKEGCG